MSTPAWPIPGLRSPPPAQLLQDTLALARLRGSRQPRLAAQADPRMEGRPVDNLRSQAGVQFCCRRRLARCPSRPGFPPVGEVIHHWRARAPDRILRWFPLPIARQACRSRCDRNSRSPRRQIPQRSRTVCAKPGPARPAPGTPPGSVAKRSALIFGIFAEPGFCSCR